MNTSNDGDNDKSSADAAMKACSTAETLTSAFPTVTTTTTTTIAEEADKNASETTTTTATSASSSAATTDRHWDKTDCKVIVHGVEKFTDGKEMLKQVAKWKVTTERVRKPVGQTWAVLIMPNTSSAGTLVDYVNSNSDVCSNRKGRPYRARLATEDCRDNNNKRARNPNNTHVTKRARTTEATRRPVSLEEIKDKVTPLWKQDKKEQEGTKMKELIHKCACRIIKDLQARFRLLNKDNNRREKLQPFDWIKKKGPIHITDMKHPPTPFRNKNEFSFGYRYTFDDTAVETTVPSAEKVEVETVLSAAGDKKDSSATTRPIKKEPSLGFMVTGWSGGVSLPHGCGNIPPEICTLVEVVEKFLQSSPLPPYDSKEHTGFWRTLTIRHSRRTRECMVIFMHTAVTTGGMGDESKNKDERTDFGQHFETERGRLVELLLSSDLAMIQGSPLKVTSIFFQEFSGVSNPGPEHPVQHVHGKKFLTEKLGDCEFQISPGAFFQVNTEGAEILYSMVVEKVREVSNNPEKTLLFDVCCGTGTIGLTCMKAGAVASVVGVDISQPAIEDAKNNAKLNGYEDNSSTRFIAGKAEKVLLSEIRVAKSKDMKFVAVVDPSREGLHADVVKALRSNPEIDRIVYVSCNPTGSLSRDAVLLCQPTTKKYAGKPFKITSASPVDMFPLTSHCEMIMTFDRMVPAEKVVP